MLQTNKLAVIITSIFVPSSVATRHDVGIPACAHSISCNNRSVSTMWQWHWRIWRPSLPCTTTLAMRVYPRARAWRRSSWVHRKLLLRLLSFRFALHHRSPSRPCESDPTECVPCRLEERERERAWVGVATVNFLALHSERPSVAPILECGRPFPNQRSGSRAAIVVS